ncbi:MAG: MATE family efflux transporter [Oscillospiraceae bacterium]|nr:MATE family efflux transporter [Oscillospiraceae bacterium]
MEKQDKRRPADFTTGEPVKKLILFSLPLIAIMIIQALYNTADSIIVGRLVGEDALAAVSTSGTVTQLILMLMMGAAQGVGVILSQYYGAKDEIMVKRVVATGTYIVMALSIVLGLIGAALAEPLLRLINVPENIMADSVLYLRIILLGTPVTAAYNMVSGIARSTGDSMTPMIVLIISAVLNVVLNYIFVRFLHLAVAGVAYATIIAQVLSAVVCIIIVWRKLPVIRPTRETIGFDREVLGGVIRIGIPAILQSSASSIGNMLMARVLNGYGSTVIAAYHSALKVEMLISYAPGGITGAMQVWTGQNIGAKKFDRIRLGYNASAKVIIGYSCFSAAVMLFFGKPLVGLFTSGGTDTEFIAIGTQYLAVACTGLLSVGFLFLSRSTLVGAGDANAALATTLLELGGRLVAAYGLSYLFGYVGFFFAAPVGYTCGAIFATARYLRGKWKEKSLVKSSQEGSKEVRA